MTAIRLPVSGLAVAVRCPTGGEDVLLAEAPACDWPMTLRLVGLLATTGDGDPVDCGALSVTDADALLLELRRALVADRVRADVVCPRPACGETMEVAFNVSDYLRHHEPAPPEGVVALEEPGWFGVAGTSVSFRLPRCDDLVELAGCDDAETELVRRCVRPAGEIDRVAAAMEALAPSLSRDLETECPACGHASSVYFDARLYSLLELRQRALSVFADIHAIAASFHWSEAEILALPRSRRLRYAELARSGA